MNLDKYWETNIAGSDFIHIQKQDYKKLSIYTKFLWRISTDAKILEIWPWNWKFLYFLQEHYKLDENNLSTVDISKSVVGSLNKNKITKKFNNYLSDSIKYLSQNTWKFDVIIMKHVIEHMEKPYIIELIPILMKALSKKWKILIETPNMVSIPLWVALYYRDFSHYTGFTEKSLEEAFLWYSKDKFNISFYNLYLNIINYKNLLTIIISFLTKYLYKLYIYLILGFYKISWLESKVWTTGLICVIIKK